MKRPDMSPRKTDGCALQSTRVGWLARVPVRHVRSDEKVRCAILLKERKLEMSDIRLFRIENNHVSVIEGQSVAIEKSLQTSLENHLDAFLGVRLVKSEHSTGKTHGGRIDTLGIDENDSPVIIEYKRSLNENVINQGLYYLDWLLDHKGEFVLLAQKAVPNLKEDDVDWSGARLLCIAGEFTKFDEHAVKQINRNIELIRYRRYGNELLLLELVNASTGDAAEQNAVSSKPTAKYVESTVSEKLAKATVEVKDRFESLKAFAEALGDDVQVKVLKQYIAFKHLRTLLPLKSTHRTKIFSSLSKPISITPTLKKDSRVMYVKLVTLGRATWKSRSGLTMIWRGLNR